MECLTLSVAEFAKALGVAEPTVYTAVKRGEIPAVRIGDRVLIPKAVLDHMFEQSGQQEALAEPERLSLGSEEAGR